MIKRARRENRGRRTLWWQSLLRRGLGGLLVVYLLGLGAATVVISSPSPSLPPGYYIRALPLHPLRIGDLVMVEVPAVLKPSVPSWYSGRWLLKQVAGLAGTAVCWEATRMVVQGPGQEVHYLVPPQPPMVPQREGCTVLGDDEMLIVGRHARSIDSRYVGPVSTNLVRFRVWPLWTWASSQEREAR